ncbi:MAG: hypothetical protein FWC27_12520 [Firmicutes bacterium]|nr:hypothetical protein [Bacillota bacterium]
MTKGIPAAVLAFALAISLAACGTEGRGETAAATAEASTVQAFDIAEFDLWLMSRYKEAYKLRCNAGLYYTHQIVEVLNGTLRLNERVLRSLIETKDKLEAEADALTQLVQSKAKDDSANDMEALQQLCVLNLAGMLLSDQMALDTCALALISYTEGSASKAESHRREAYRLFQSTKEYMDEFQAARAAMLDLGGLSKSDAIEKAENDRAEIEEQYVGEVG